MKNSELVRMGAKKPPGRFSMPPTAANAVGNTFLLSLSVALGTLLCSKEVLHVLRSFATGSQMGTETSCSTPKLSLSLDLYAHSQRLAHLRRTVRRRRRSSNGATALVTHLSSTLHPYVPLPMSCNIPARNIFYKRHFS